MTGEPTMEQNLQETTVRDYVRVLFRHKAVIVVTFITVMATVVLGLMLKTPIYIASVKMLISAEKQVESPYYRDLLRSQSMEIVLTQSEIVKSNPIIERAVKATGLYDRPLNYEARFCSPLKKVLVDYDAENLTRKLSKIPEEQRKAILFRLVVEDLKKNVNVEPIRDTNLFTISVREYSPIGAAILANVVSRSYVIFDLEQQLSELELKYGKKHLAVKQLKDNIETMVKSLNGEPLSNTDAIGPASVKILEQAQIPMKPTGPGKYLTLILALFMAPFLGIMLAFMFEYMDHSVKSPDEVEQFFSFPFLGAIPKKKRHKKEALRALSDQVYLLMKDKGMNSLLIASILPREGAATVTANLGKQLAYREKRKVLVIDANMRNPLMRKAFKLPEGPGLAEVLEDKATMAEAVKNVSIADLARTKSKKGAKNKELTAKSYEPRANDNNSCLNILPAGETSLNPVTLLGVSKMKELMEEAKKEYDLVLVNCADLKDFRDGTVLSAYVDGVAIVINEGGTRREVIKSAIAPLEKRNVNIIGGILNNRRYHIPKFMYNWV
jgi:Mrp family chromosome partitioning ATPase